MNLRTFIDLHAGGPGSGCTGDNCGRPPGSSSQNAHSVGDRVYSIHQSTDKGVVQKTSGPWHLVKTASKGDQVYHDKELTKVPTNVQGKEMLTRISTALNDTVTRFEAQKLRDDTAGMRFQQKQARSYNADMTMNRYIVGHRMLETVQALAKSNPEVKQLADRASFIFHRQEEREASEDKFRRTDHVKVMAEQLQGLKLLQTAMEKLHHEGIKSGYDDLGIYMDAYPSAHPPSLKNPQKVPADQPGETNDRFLDVTRRNDITNELLRDRRTRNSSGQPTAVRTTLVEPGTFVPFDKA
jgi:hypothetical protein